MLARFMVLLVAGTALAGCCVSGTGCATGPTSGAGAGGGGGGPNTKGGGKGGGRRGFFFFFFGFVVFVLLVFRW